MSTTETVNERLAALTAAGTSVWLDEIRRDLVRGGGLARLARVASLRGVTANPAIFERAIVGTTAYDEQLAELGARGASAIERYEAIATTDVREACDVLRGIWEDTGHGDGFVSLEVDPDLAHDTERTLEQVRRFWRVIDRPNAMIKVPATPEGVAAIEQATFEGINVNVTLLFAVDAYRAIAEAYIRGMERRREEGRSLDVRSVASFFVSRVDAEVDRRLGALGREELQGIAGVANARNAYRAFTELFLGERFARLREAGAPLQRPLWASTGVKDPRRRDTLYVEQLVAPHTVNTMPMATLHATADHAEISRPTAQQDPAEELARLAEAGIDLADVTENLLQGGVDAFLGSMHRLLASLEAQPGVLAPAPPVRAQGEPTPAGQQRGARRREAKRRFTTALGRRLVNPPVKAAVHSGVAPPTVAVLETTGRTSGQPRRTPVGNGLDGEAFWIVAEHGFRSAYVRNIRAHPRVRVKVGGRWREGTAALLPGDDPRARQRLIGRRLNAAVVRAMGTDLLTVRIDLRPAPPVAAASSSARQRAFDGLVGGAVAAGLSGVPSTLHALVATGRPLEAPVAAGSLLLPGERRTGRLLLAAVPVHLSLSLVWGVGLALLLPRRHPLLGGAAGGLAIAALDLGLIGRRLPRIAALPQGPQAADHLAFAVAVAAVVHRRRKNRRA